VQPPIRELTDIRVTVDDVVHMPGLDAPPDKPHPFVYFISIHNDSTAVVTIRARKWILRGDDGDVMVVEGQGVVGQMPEIEPGGHFSYNSYHVIGGPASVSGAFFGESADGGWFFTRIPGFELRPPPAHE
jgi:ApaG protein